MYFEVPFEVVVAPETEWALRAVEVFFESAGAGAVGIASAGAGVAVAIKRR